MLVKTTKLIIQNKNANYTDWKEDFGGDDDDDNIKKKNKRNAFFPPLPLQVINDSYLLSFVFW